MRYVSPATQAALEQNAVKVRDFIWFAVRDRDSGGQVTAGYWSDVGRINAEVIDPETQQPVTRQYDGAGTLIALGPITLVSNLTVQVVEVGLSQVSDANALVRAYDAKQARVEIHRGLFDPHSLAQIEPAFPRFFGFVDVIDIGTPSEGEDGGISLTCVSHTQEMTRSNPATRSDVYQQRRLAGDTFRQHAASVGTWQIKWGEAS